MLFFKKHKTAEELREIQAQKSLDAIRFLMNAAYIKAINEGRKPTRLELLEEVKTTLEGWIRVLQGPSLERQMDQNRVAVHFAKGEDAYNFADVFDGYGATVGKNNEAYVPMEQVGNCYDTTKMASTKTRNEIQEEKTKPTRVRNKPYRPKTQERRPSWLYHAAASERQKNLINKVVKAYEKAENPPFTVEEIEALGKSPSVGAAHDFLDMVREREEERNKNLPTEKRSSIVSEKDFRTDDPQEAANRLREMLEKQGIETLNGANGSRFAVADEDIPTVKKLAAKCYSGDPHDLKIAVVAKKKLKSKAPQGDLNKEASHKKQMAMERS